jgi:hypothetical protein
MKLNLRVSIRQGIAYFLVIAGSALLSTNAAAHTQRELGDGCLQFNPEQLEVLGAERGSPFYEFPQFYFPVTTADGHHFDAAVKFVKRRDGVWEEVVNSTRIVHPNCNYNDYAYGLTAVTSNPEAACGVGDHLTYYYSALDDDYLKTVRVGCRQISNNACNMRYILSNDWRATIRLPQNHLSDWRDVADATQAYFEYNLQECGETQ